MRYGARISYTGTAYSGWQRQAYGVGVQQRVEESFESIFGRRIVVTAAGRTDAGVHASGQIISFNLDSEWRPDRLRLALNSYLPEDIRLMEVARMPEDFDARGSAHWREYRYLIWHGSVLSPFFVGRAWWDKFYWDMAEVRKACALYEGTHDYRAFCKTAECPDDSVRTVLRASLRTRKNMTIFTVRGKSFLTNMVRVMIGNLQAVGRGKISAEDVAGLLTGGDRKQSFLTAPAEGLYFWKAGYGRHYPAL
ncbi:MAG: tRNA pseudouridine(38-40) synthase TruA [Synergistaceae bacterium]|nr:tRNA pseudouridine(38-40) synthase TruA [Synergistaceae bacterium]